ncbi:MAG: alpha/beta fold hydrolase [Burkholderiaceae bacterium]
MAPATGADAAPGLLLMLLETRAPLEYMALLASMPWLSRLPRGDGHPVIVFPGLGASDLSTRPLRNFLRRRGYAPCAWGRGFNLGPRAGVLDHCRRLVTDAVQRQGQPVSLIGWSLGGIYAREIAKEQPTGVRCVITLGTPFSGHPRATNAWRLYERINGKVAHDEPFARQLRTPPSCPTTSIFSRSDGIVAWRCSLNAGAPNTENIEVPASHIGMGLNPLVLAVIADRLAQDPQHWQPFEVSGVRRFFFRLAPQASHPESAGGDPTRTAA